jgi:hypothetical protein
MVALQPIRSKGLTIARRPPGAATITSLRERAGQRGTQAATFEPCAGDHPVSAGSKRGRCRARSSQPSHSGGIHAPTGWEVSGTEQRARALRVPEARAPSKSAARRPETLRRVVFEPTRQTADHIRVQRFPMPARRPRSRLRHSQGARATLSGATPDPAAAQAGRPRQTPQAAPPSVATPLPSWPARQRRSRACLSPEHLLLGPGRREARWWRDLENERERDAVERLAQMLPGAT